MQLAQAHIGLPTPSRKAIERACCGAVFTFGAAWWISFMQITRITLEDAFITFRYAQNLATGHGLVYNTGQRVLGTTTPLLTLLLAAAGRLAGVASIPTVSTYLMLGCGLLTAAVGYRLLAEIGFPLLARLLFVALYFGSRVLLISATGGMETSLVLLCMIASAWAYVRDRPAACLALCAVLCLTRIDGLLWTGVLAAAMVLRDRRVPWKGLAAFAALTLPWILFSFWYFGSPIPHTVAAKQLIGQSTYLYPALSRQGVSRFAFWYMTSRIEDGTAAALMMSSLILLGCGARAYLDSTRARSLGGALMTYLLAYALFLHFGRAPHFQWYLAPSTLCFLLLMGPGLWSFSQGAARLLPGKAALFEGALAMLIVAGFCLLQDRGLLRAQRESQANEEMRREVGLWLRDNTPAGSSVAMEAIGYQGYFSDRRIIDLAGLVSPEVVSIKKTSRSNAELFARLLVELEPDYLVLRSAEYDLNAYFDRGKLFETPAQREAFDRSYGEVRRFAGPYPERWGRMAYLTVYERRRPSR